jgi:putative transposase
MASDRKTITFTENKGVGKLKLKGTRDLHFYQLAQIKRVRLVKRADGYFVQFCVQVDRYEKIEVTGKAIGLDVGLKEFYTDSNRVAVENPRFLRKGERRLKKAQRRVSKRVKGSQNRKKARVILGKPHLKISRQRKDFAVKLALRRHRGRRPDCEQNAYDTDRGREHGRCRTISQGCIVRVCAIPSL